MTVHSGITEGRQELRETWEQLGDLMARNEPVSQRARYEAMARYARSFAGMADRLSELWATEERNRS